LHKPNKRVNLKKLFASFFILVFLYTLVGYYPIFLFQQNNIKKEIKKRIKQTVPESELQVLVFNQGTISQINWVDENEFLFKGNLYDIVRFEKNQNGETVYYCINDNQEKKLFASLDKLIQNAFEGKTNSEKTHNPVKHLVKDYLPNGSLVLHTFSIQEIKFVSFSDNKEVDFSGTTSPPPRTS
jgi:hypothetical protein